MKKAILTILILQSIVLMSSCKKTGGTNFEYIFADINQVLMKIDVHTGKATPLCSDPLCDHLNDNCPFFGAGTQGNRFVPLKNNEKVYFIAGGYETEKKFLKRYDLAAGKVEICYETTNFLSSLFLADPYLLFIETFYKDESKKGNGDKDNTALNILRFDTESGKIEKLNSEPLEGNQLLLNVKKDRLIWVKNDLGSTYSTTFDYKDINYDVDALYADESKGDAYIKFEYNGPQKQTFTLYKISKDKKVEVCNNVYYYINYADYSLYTKALDKKEIIGEDDSISEMKHYKYNDNKLYYIKKDGSGHKELCDFGEHYFHSIMNQANYQNSYNEYQLISFKDYQFNSNGKITSDKEKYAVLNMKTGEYKFVET